MSVVVTATCDAVRGHGCKTTPVVVKTMERQDVPPEWIVIELCRVRGGVGGGSTTPGTYIFCSRHCLARWAEN